MPRVQIEPALALVVGGPHGALIYDRAHGASADALRRAVTDEVHPEGLWRDVLSSGETLVGERRGAFAAAATGRSEPALRRAVSTMLDTIHRLHDAGLLPSEAPRPSGAPPSGSGGPSGAPALIAAFTPPRRTC